jgi:hypothetical protein
MADRKPRFRIDPIDTVRGVSAAAGVGLVGYGCWLHYEPLGFIVGGALLFVMGVVAALRAR